VKRVTLTFDNGPEPIVTATVLDCLLHHDVKTTFFVLGSKVILPTGRAIAERAAGEGHWIGNHTFSHTRPLGELDYETALGEFEQTEEALAWVKQPAGLFRPYGSGGVLGPKLLHPAIVERLLTRKYSCVLWNCVPGDWRDPDGWMARALVDCTSRDWSLVVLHDLPTGAMSHLDTFIRCLKDQGFILTQEYPPDCVPIVGGRIVLPLESYMS